MDDFINIPEEDLKSINPPGWVKLDNKSLKAKLSVTLIKKELLAQVIHFFGTIKEEQSTEANVWLCVEESDIQGKEDHAKGNFKDINFLLVTPALVSVSGGEVHRHQYEMFCPVCRVTAKDTCEICGGKDLRPMRWAVNIHSHGGGGAFWSGIDDYSHKSESGIYTVIGKNGTKSVDVLTSFTFDKKRFALDTASVFSIPDKSIKSEWEDIWVKYYKYKKKVYKTLIDSKDFSFSSRSVFTRPMNRTASHYTEDTLFNCDAKEILHPDEFNMEDANITILSEILGGKHA